MENSIEETIKIIEKMIKSYKEADECGLSNNDFKNEIKALEHILSEYKKVLKENEYMHNELDKQQTTINKYAKENELAKQSLIKNLNIADERNNLLVENQKLKQENEELKKRIPSFENGTYLGDYDGLVKFQNELDKLQKENEELKSKIENKDKYFGLITGLGYDYDGYYNRETSNGNIKDLADLIDELVQAARDGLNDIPYLFDFSLVRKNNQPYQK